ncbi:MAG TPA: DUF4325 domain-containing protein [Cytophagales bacterium]|nr:DUF4325 domain-containing protein [Cytophagales bacterium]
MEYGSTTTWNYRGDNAFTIQLSRKMKPHNVKEFCNALSAFKRTNSDSLFLDFGEVRYAYPNGVLPIIASIEQLRQNGTRVNIRLPYHYDTRKLFHSVNWAHFLNPDKYRISEFQHDRHLVTRNFTNAIEQTNIVDDFMDVVLRSMTLPRNIISGLEWSINEIMDNVLNHSNSEIGGFVQATTFPKEKTIAFAVVDSGKGILNSLREGIPTLRTDLQAIGEAVKAGVTRNPKFGQGNGLAGSLKITTLSGGSFEIMSGTGSVLIKQQNTVRKISRPSQRYFGTLVCGEVKVNDRFSISEALDFGQGEYTPNDVIEMQYEMEDKDCLIIKMRNETTGFGTRFSGNQIRTKILNLINAEPTFPLVIDWEGVPVISSSFADELIGKLFLKLGAMTFSSRIRNTGMEQLIRSLLDKAVAQRLNNAKDTTRG